MRHLLSPLKPALVPVFNRLVHGSRALVRVIEAILKGRWRHCHCCGRTTPEIRDRRVLAPRLIQRWGLSPDLVEAFLDKESRTCLWCGAKRRADRLAQVLLEVVAERERALEPSRSLSHWARTESAQKLDLAEINRIDGIHECLGSLPGHRASDYCDIAGAQPGAVYDGMRHEDLTELTYPDASFDLVLTSESLEHVPDLDAALREIRRILRPGGIHLMTIPVRPDVAATYLRARIDDLGQVQHLHEPVYHPGGDQGYFVFREFGSDVQAILEQAGFSVDVRFGPNRLEDVGQVYLMRKTKETNTEKPKAV